MNRADNFNRGDTTNAIGTPSDAGSDWSQLQGTWGISSNQAYESGSSSHAICVLETSESDGDLQVTMAANDNGGLVARASDGSNYILLELSSDTPQMRLFTCIAGAFTQLGSTFSGGMNPGDVYKLTVNGTTIEGYQNGVLRVSGSSSHNQSETKHGIRSHLNTALRLDDFSFTGTGGGTTPKNVFGKMLSGPFGGVI